MLISLIVPGRVLKEGGGAFLEKNLYFTFSRYFFLFYSVFNLLQFIGLYAISNNSANKTFMQCSPGSVIIKPGVWICIESRFIILRHIYKIWEQNLALKWWFLPEVCQLRSQCSFVRTWYFLNMNFSQQMVAEILSFPKTFNIWVFEKRVFSKKLEFSQNRQSCQIWCRMTFKWYNFSKEVISTPILRFFLPEKQKIFNVSKLGKNDEEGMFFREKNIFIFFKTFFTKMGCH